MPPPDCERCIVTREHVRRRRPNPVPEPSPTGPRVIGGVGTELKCLLSWFGQDADPECNCAKHAEDMDRHGIEWCASHKSEIMGWLAEEAARRTVLGFSLDRVPGFRMGVMALIELAISHARIKGAGAPVRRVHRRHRRAFTLLPLVGQPIDPARRVSHIVFHVMPVAGDQEPIWRRYCRWLREVRPQFNGRMIIGVVTPGENDQWKYCPPEAVIDELKGLDAEFVVAPNQVGVHDRNGIGEGVLFPLMLEKLETTDPDHICFYGHCKGVTRPARPRHAPPQWWGEVMFDTLFRNQAATVKTLDDHGVCGPFLMRGGDHRPIGLPGVSPDWFFSGTYFAMRLADVFARQWRYLPHNYGCVEQWPRHNFDLHTQAACLFQCDVDNLYDVPYWQNQIWPAYRQWQDLYLDRQRITILLTTSGRITLTRALDAIYRNELRAGDEVLLVNDGPENANVRQAWDRADLPGRLINIEHGPHRDWGHTPRNLILPQITGGYVVHMDDDDICTDNAISDMRRAIAEHPGSLFLFRMQYPDAIYPATYDLSRGNVGTGSIVHPAAIPLGQFDPASHEGDFDFIDQTVQLNPSRAVVWRDEIIKIANPD